MARLIPAHGEIVEIKYDTREPSLALMQRLVGGSIEIVTLMDGRMLVMNEEIKFGRHEKNELASIMAMEVIAKSDYIAGNVILLEKGEIS